MIIVKSGRFAAGESSREKGRARRRWRLVMDLTRYNHEKHYHHEKNPIIRYHHEKHFSPGITINIKTSPGITMKKVITRYHHEKHYHQVSPKTLKSHQVSPETNDLTM